MLDLQKRVAGVLPVRVDVPRAGNSYRFARALVLDEETKVTFTYKTMARNKTGSGHREIGSSGHPKA